jgi:Cu+-exporting ATPase
MEKSEIARDPVCGMRVNKSDSHHTSVYKGEEYYFCSEGCKKAFDYAPEKYIGNQINSSK